MKQSKRQLITMMSAVMIFMSGILAGKIGSWISLLMVIPYAFFYVELMQVRDSEGLGD